MYLIISLVLFLYLQNTDALRARSVGARTLKSRFSTPSPGELSLLPLRSSLDDEGGGLSLKTLGVAAFLGIGVFGGGFLSSLSGIGKDVALEAKRSAESRSKGVPSSASSSRGALTKLTRREINAKLAQVPVFFVKNQAGGVYTDEGGEGKFFETKADAEKFASAMGGGQVGAATMDEVYYPLLKKSQKLSVSGPIAANSNAEGKYALVPPESEVKKAGGPTFTEKHPSDFPLYRVPKLAFSKETGFEFPLFTEISSATGAYERLQEDKVEKGGKTQQQEVVRPEDYQITSLLDVVELWSVGGSEGRTLEIYPSMEEISNYKSLR